MADTILIGLINNAAVLLAMGVIYDTLYRPKSSSRSLLYQIASGMILGVMAVILMSVPVKLESGLIFDMRTILLGLTGLFFGAIPTIISMTIAAAYRIFLGGTGVIVGVATIVTASVIGLLWRKFRGNKLQKISLDELYLLGIVIHIGMMLCMLLLPQELRVRFFSNLALPVIIIYPVGTALLGGLLASSQKRHAAEENVRLLLNSTAEGIYGIDLEGKCTFCNIACIKMLGYTHEDELLGKNLHHVIHHGHHDGTPCTVEDCRISNAFRLGKECHVDDEVLWKADGTCFMAEYWSYPQIKDGETIGAVVTFLNITERVQAEESLRESNERFSVAFNQAPVLLTISNLESAKLLDVNRAFLEVSGFSRQEVIGKTPVELGLIPEADRSLVMESILKDGSVRNLDLTLRAKSGKPLLCKYWGEIISSGGQKRILSLALDVTEKHRVEEQLQQAQKMESVGRLAGGVAHDFNNMLSVILGHAELGLMRLEPSSPVRANLTEIRTAAERSSDLTRQLLAFARKQAIEPRVLDLNETVALMLKMLQRLIGENIHIHWQPAPELWRVKVDPSQIDQILANLCVNARDAISETGKIAIVTENISIDKEHASQLEYVPGDYVKLTFSDSGSGMDKETLSHIFEPYYTTKELGKGTGMGLATVFGAVKQNNGHINVYSEPGLGTIFTIYLPRYESKVGETLRTDAVSSIPCGQETILLVDDEPTIQDIAKTMLESLGYSVLTAGSPGEAVQLAREYDGEIHLLLTDVIMPVMNGRELAEEIQLVYPSMKRLFMSGYTADVIAPRGVLAEGVQFIQKPFSLLDMATKVRKAIDS